LTKEEENHNVTLGDVFGGLFNNTENNAGLPGHEENEEND